MSNVLRRLAVGHRARITRFACIFVASGVLGAVAAPPQASAEDTIVVQRKIEARTYDPQQVVSTPASEVLALVTDTLVAIDDDLKTISPMLAKSWTISPDGKTYTFTLRDDVKFCSGKPMTAADVEATYTRWLAPETKSNNKIFLGPLQKVTATGAYTVEFRLAKPYSEFLAQMTQPYGGIINIDEARALGDQFGTTHLDGTGPYCWDYWHPREEISVRRHEGYHWGPAFYANKGAPKIDRLLLKLVPEDNSRIASLAAGDSQISYVIPPTGIKSFKDNPSFAIAEPRAFGFIAFIGMKIHRPLMADPAVRRALNMAMDRDLIVDALYHGQAEPASFVVRTTTDGYDPSIVPILPKYDVAGARRILDDAGWKVGSDGIRSKNGVRLAPVVIGYDAWREMLEAAQGFAREIGIDLQLQIADAPMTIARVSTKDDFDMWGYYASYMNLAEMLGKYFVAREPLAPYRFVPEQGTAIDAAIQAGREALSDADRTANYNKAEKLIAEGMYWVPLAHEEMLVIYNKAKVKGVRPHGLGGNGLYKALDLEVVK